MMIDKNGSPLREVFGLGVFLFMGMTLVFVLKSVFGTNTPEEARMLMSKSSLSLVAEMVCLNLYLLVDYAASLKE